MTAIDLFAGPGGWDEAARALGVPDVVGYEIDGDACATAEAAGHKRVQADLSMINTLELGPIDGLIGSPPCQSYSAAGKGLGKLDRPRIEAHVARIRAAGRWLHYSREGWHDPRSRDVLEPLRYALDLQPEWIALEQVRAVLPLWEAIAGVLHDQGYHTDTGLLSAEQYGVPQTRLRAFLIARKCTDYIGVACPHVKFELPAPTHRKYRKGVPQDAGDLSLLPWVSMAQALGWGLPLPGPSPTITGGGTDAGGAEPIAHMDRYRPDMVLRQSAMSNATVRRVDEPAPTITAGHDRGERVWEPAAARFGNQEHSAVRAISEPAATIRYSERMNSNDWIGPATTVQGDPRIAPRGHHDRQMNGAVRVTVEEAAVLQSFPADYPWQGSCAAQYRQVGDAIPVLLAEAVLRAVI